MDVQRYKKLLADVVAQFTVQPHGYSDDVVANCARSIGPEFFHSGSRRFATYQCLGCEAVLTRAEAIERIATVGSGTKPCFILCAGCSGP
jgi:hypothetical protein